MDGIFRTLDLPPKPKWEWCVAGDWHSMTWRVQTPPHRLGRFMQQCLLDIHWREIDECEK
jgi:hypothetical protein